MAVVVVSCLLDDVRLEADLFITYMLSLSSLLFRCNSTVVVVVVSCCRFGAILISSFSL